MIAPVFLWRDAESSARSWRIDVKFADRAKGLRVVSAGEGMKVGEIDDRCVSTANKPPFLTPEQAAAHTWNLTRMLGRGSRSTPLTVRQRCSSRGWMKRGGR